MPTIPNEDELNWTRRVRRPFFIFNALAMIPVATELIGYALDYLSPSYFTTLGFGPAAVITLLGPVELASIPVNLVIAIAMWRRDPVISLLASVMLLVVVGLLVAINAKGLFGLIAQVRF